MVVEVVGGQLEIELLLEFHHDVDDHGGVEPQAVEFHLAVDAVRLDPHRIAERRHAKFGDFFSRHVRIRSKTGGHYGRASACQIKPPGACLNGSFGLPNRPAGRPTGKTLSSSSRPTAALPRSAAG